MLSMHNHLGDHRHCINDTSCPLFGVSLIERRLDGLEQRINRLIQTVMEGFEAMANTTKDLLVAEQVEREDLLRLIQMAANQTATINQLTDQIANASLPPDQQRDLDAAITDLRDQHSAMVAILPVSELPPPDNTLPGTMADDGTATSPDGGNVVPTTGEGDSGAQGVGGTNPATTGDVVDQAPAPDQNDQGGPQNGEDTTAQDETTDTGVPFNPKLPDETYDQYVARAEAVNMVPLDLDSWNALTATPAPQ